MESEYRKGYVYIQNHYAGIISETEDGYRFCYDEAYLTKKDAVAVSLTLPLRQEPYEASIFFPFFDGLIPEGWLLGVVSRNWKINQTDRFGLLLLACKDCIGDVCIRNEEPK
ncbi:MAG: HipA N-terminal domain-containing protein [Lachnospiraceae bacterium]|nr:HipA N-terminal domain-containing protein [Lachnospiraceae bacterium]